MDQQTAQKVKEALAKNEKIAILVGKNPSIDDMAAALSLYLGLSKQYKDISISLPNEPLVELSSLVGINKVKTTLGSEGGDLIVSFPYKEGEIEKVSYTLEEGYLNIVVKAGPDGLTFSERDIQYKRGGAFPTLLFIIGTPRLADLGSLFDPEGLKDTTVINIDNKSENQGFGDIVLVSQGFSSVSEQIATLLQALDFDLDIDISQNLLSGISFATDNFQKPTTSASAFEIAGQLMKKGAVRASITSRLQTQDPFYKPSSSTGIRENLDKFQKDDDKKIERELQRKDKKDSKEPPADWLVPKVYKGSTNI